MAQVRVSLRQVQGSQLTAAAEAHSLQESDSDLGCGLTGRFDYEPSAGNGDSDYRRAVQ